MGRSATPLLLAAIALGCSNPPPPSPPPAPSASGVATTETKVPEQFIDRGHLEHVLRQGPGWLLERVPIEEVIDGKTFVGWRLRELPIEWKDVDLQPGDVVTAVNTMPVETPSDFWAAWTTLGVASELKVTYQRDGEERELSVPILGQASPVTSEQLGKLQGEAPPPKGPTQPDAQGKGTVVIKDQQRPITDTMVDWSD